MDMHPPAYVMVQLQTPAQAPVQTPPVETPPAETAPVEPPPATVDVTRYIPHTAVSIVIIVTVRPPSGAALVYAPGYENQATLFKGPKSADEVRLAGPFIYVKLIGGATEFDIQYLNWREP